MDNPLPTSTLGLPPQMDVLQQHQLSLAARVLQTLHVLNYDLTMIDNNKLPGAEEFWSRVKETIAQAYGTATSAIGKEEPN